MNKKALGICFGLSLSTLFIIYEDYTSSDLYSWIREEKQYKKDKEPFLNENALEAYSITLNSPWMEQNDKIIKLDLDEWSLDVESIDTKEIFKDVTFMREVVGYDSLSAYLFTREEDETNATKELNELFDYIQKQYNKEDVSI